MDQETLDIEPLPFGAAFTIEGVSLTRGGFNTNCKPGEETVFANNLQGQPQ